MQRWMDFLTVRQTREFSNLYVVRESSMCEAESKGKADGLHYIT